MSNIRTRSSLVCENYFTFFNSRIMPVLLETFSKESNIMRDRWTTNILLLVKSQYLLSKFYLRLLSNLNTYDKFVVSLAEEPE